MARRTVRRRSGVRRGRPAVEVLECRQLLAAPAIDPIGPATLPVGRTLYVPVTGSDPDGGPVTYTVTSGSPGVVASARQGRPHLRLAVQGFGVLEFQLFNDLAPETVRRITELVEQGFYDNLTFHRVVPGFVIQGGDPRGDGTGGPGFRFDDEFNPLTMFTGTGQLAMANSGKDTNGSQFFVTLGPQRPLDFNHTIFGQLVRGAEVAEAISRVNRGLNDRPAAPVVISEARIVADESDAVLFLLTTPAAAPGPVTITVTASDAAGASSATSFAVNLVAETVDTPPILGPVADRSVPMGEELTFELTSNDLEGDPVEYLATLLSDPADATVMLVDHRVTVTPRADFSGPLSLLVGVKQQGATRRGSTPDPFDTQRITVDVLPPTLEAQARAFAGVAGLAANNVAVAGFSSSSGVFPASAYSASIEWGDGATSAGTVVDDGALGFLVLGSHTYETAGSFPVAVAIAGPGGGAATASSTATVAEARDALLTVGVTAAPDPLIAGGDLTYAIVVRNVGTAAARGVTLSQSLPAGMVILSTSIAPDLRDDDLISFALGEIAPGESRTITIVGRPTVAGTVAATARLTGQGFAEVSAGAVTTVNPAPVAPSPDPGPSPEPPVVPGPDPGPGPDPDPGPDPIAPPTTPGPPDDPTADDPTSTVADGVPARVINLQRFGVGNSPTRIVLTFDRPIDRARAEDVRNYQIVLPGKDGRMGTRHDVLVPILRASYDDESRTVTLEPGYRLPYVQFARLRIRSGGALGLADSGGLALDGDGDGEAGGPFVARFGRGVYVERAEVLRESTGPNGRVGPLRLVVRAGGQAFRGAAIAPLFNGQRAMGRFLLASGRVDPNADGASAAALGAGVIVPRGPRAVLRLPVPRPS